MAQQPIEDQGLPTDCCPLVHLPAEMKDHPTTLGVMCDQHVASPSHCWLSRLELQ